MSLGRRYTVIRSMCLTRESVLHELHSAQGWRCGARLGRTDCNVFRYSPPLSRPTQACTTPTCKLRVCTFCFNPSIVEMHDGCTLGGHWSLEADNFFTRGATTHRESERQRHTWQRCGLLPHSATLVTAHALAPRRQGHTHRAHTAARTHGLYNEPWVGGWISDRA